jgi:hypothetical protein
VSESPGDYHLGGGDLRRLLPFSIAGFLIGFMVVQPRLRSVLFDGTVELVATIIAAYFVWHLFEKERKEREDQRRIDAQEAEREAREAANRHLIRSTLLQQFPPILRDLLELQQQAGESASDGLRMPGAVSEGHIVAATYRLRHFANVHARIDHTLDTLGGPLESPSPYFLVANCLAWFALEGLGDRRTPHGLYEVFRASVGNIVAQAENNSHLERMRQLLDDAEESARSYTSLDRGERFRVLCRWSDAIFHSAVLYADAIQQSFREMVEDVTQFPARRVFGGRSDEATSAQRDLFETKSQRKVILRGHFHGTQ